jgi:hypothetical protein
VRVATLLVVEVGDGLDRAGVYYLWQREQAMLLTLLSLTSYLPNQQ